MAKSYQRKTTGPKNGTRTTVTRSSDGSIRTTYSSGPKWARTAYSFKNGQERVTRSSTQDGWTTRTTQVFSNSNRVKRPRKYRSSSKDKMPWFWIILFVLYLIYIS